MTLSELLRLSSRTFALGIERLPGALREAVQVAYLLLRVSDYLEDNTDMPPERKIALLGLWEAVLAGRADVGELTSQLPAAEGSHPDALVAGHAADVVAGVRALPPQARAPVLAHVRDSTLGMARWAARGPLVRDEGDLDDYMHEVAGRVGYLLTELFSWHSGAIRRRKEALMPLGREFGLALQTVNVIRGMKEDYGRGWIFVPETFCARVGLSREQLFQLEHRAPAMRVLDMMVEKAQRHLRAATEYLQALPPWQHRIRLFCMLPLLFAVRTLAISRQNQRVLDDEAKMSREEVLRIVHDSARWGWSNGWIERYSARLGAVG